MTPAVTKAVTPEEIRQVLTALADLPAEASASERWDVFARPTWPALFRLLDLGADLPRFAPQTTLASWKGGLWPELEGVRDQVVRLQELVDRPTVPVAARQVDSYGSCQVEEATRDLQNHHCVHVDFLLDTADRAALEREIDAMRATKLGSWGELERAAAPGVYEIFDRALGSEHFRWLTGFEADRDEFTLTLSLQDLDAAGIGWHRDLYWPREWVGEDVFAVLYALGTDTPELGGAFVYYVPWENEIFAFYRAEHQATVLWNSADADGRLLHAVTEYLTPVTARHLIILQCHRRRR